ncbi:MAG: RNA-binding S4 domain-containing protein [Armatimonadota bacterium]|nr:RNA-binding S4 domain-containing protein [Armatimonadota bacterium]
MIHTSEIALGALLKWAGIVPTGGQTKALIAAGGVRVNGVVERRRGRRVIPGDRVEITGRVVLRVERV